MDKVRAALYPEYPAFGFVKDQHRFVFFSYVSALIRPEMTVVDLGAGRDKWSEVESGYLRSLTRLKGRVAKLIGLDVDPAVLENPSVDEALVFAPGTAYPLPDASVDLITSWATLEHIAEPEPAVREIERILKPGGWFCAWTPNKWGYVGLGARLLPNSLHAKFLKGLQAERQEVDVFPTTYRMNTMGDLKRLFPTDRFEHFSFAHNGPPAYHGGRVWLARLWQAYGWLMPARLGSNLHIFIRKR